MLVLSIFGNQNFQFSTNVDRSTNAQISTNAPILPNPCACCTTQIYKNLYKNLIFRKFKYARKEEFYATIICFGQFIRPSSRG